MAGAAVKAKRTAVKESDVAYLIEQYKKLATDLELVRSKLVAHGAVAHAAVAGCDAANMLAASEIQDENGQAITGSGA